MVKVVLIMRHLWNMPPVALFIFLFLGLTPSLHAKTTPPEPLWAKISPQNITELSLEELMNIEVITVSRRTSPVGQSPAAVFVITSEMIRRSGATSLPELLRLAPGVQVARQSNDNWAISIRGLNDTFANKLLVLIDGRSIYSPSLSGVSWSKEDTLLEDIEQIEVIRGPAGTMWGANAVNGIINVITKSAKTTQGGLVSSGGGTEERGFGSVRYGGKFKEDAYYRIYAKFFNRDGAVFPDGQNAEDQWQKGQGGFRIDLDVSPKDLITIQGDGYVGRSHENLIVGLLPEQSFRDVVNIDGGNILNRWTRTLSEASDIQLQLYYDYWRLDSPQVFVVNEHTIDFDFQHRLGWGSRQKIIWGLDFRLVANSFENSFLIEVDPSSRTMPIYSGFIQDEITVIPEYFHFILGTKLEHNIYTGIEVQPNARLLWTPHENHTLWGAVSRAIRTPSRADRDLQLNLQVAEAGGVPVTLTRLPSPGFGAEELVAFELGYRVQPHKKLSFDFATFYNIYDDLFSLEPAVAPAPPPIVISANNLENSLEGKTYGGEIVGRWQMLDEWRWEMAYSLLQNKFHSNGLGQSSEAAAEGNSPEHQFSLRSQLDISSQWEFDWILRFIDGLPNINVPSYFAFDVRLGWHPKENLEFSVVGQNLFDRYHPEFTPTETFFSTTEIEQSVYGKVTWQF